MAAWMVWRTLHGGHRGKGKRELPARTKTTTYTLENVNVRAKVERKQKREQWIKHSVRKREPADEREGVDEEKIKRIRRQVSPRADFAVMTMHLWNGYGER
ncbi:hypothetical protein CBL_05280 [Carabus blaptoides fortunei]